MKVLGLEWGKLHLCSVLTLLLVLPFGIGQENYTEREKAFLSEFRELVKANLRDGYMKTDAYLIRWLRARDFNLIDARAMFEKALQWRKENKIDGILKEDLSAIFKRAPYYIDGVDNYGRPLITFNPGRWDIRRFAVNGELGDLSRLLDQMLERVARILYKVGESTGYNVTQGVVIIDLEGFNIRQHTCLQCIPPLFNWIRNFENYYPNLLAGFRIINAPRIFTPVFDLIKPLFSKESSMILKLYGPNKAEWSKELLKTIPADQLTPQYGGTKVRH